MGKPELTAKGINGQIELHGNKIRIRRKGLNAIVSHGFKGDKDILISSITSIQFKTSNLATNGYIQFSFMGGQEAKGGIKQAVKDENSVVFTKKNQSDFAKIKEAIDSRIRAGQATGPATSEAEELAKFATLKNQGIISEEEFQIKKNQILGI